MIRDCHVRRIAALLVVASLAIAAFAQRKKKSEDEITQTLEVLPDPPPSTTADPHRLVFHVSPLGANGLLSKQTRDALKALQRSMKGATPVKLRAFVAGSGDMRRVASIVSEVFSEKRQPLPALSIVQVGSLPLTGAQVVIESISVEKKSLHPNGLALVSGQAHTEAQPTRDVTELATKALQDVGKAAAAVGAQTTDVLRVTCFLTSIEGAQSLTGAVRGMFPAAVFHYVQTQRAPSRAVAECEAAVRSGQASSEPLRLVNPDGLPKSANYSQIAVVAGPKIILTGTQLQFGFQDADARLAFQRLEKVLDQAGSSVKHVAMSSVYPLSASLTEQVRRIRFEFFERQRPPASTMLEFEGLPAMEAGFAIDVVAVPR
jgi:enamine deaminase RidA (YjgF/YER057c/UK114 family)